MKKSIILMYVLNLLLFNSGIAQRSNYYHVTDNNYNDIKISFQFNIQDLKISNINTENGAYTLLSFPDMTPMQENGKPELPIMTHLLEIPLCESIQVNIVNSEYEVYNCAEIGIENPVFPVQPKHSKSEDGPFPFVIDEEAYNTNANSGEQRDI